MNIVCLFRNEGVPYFRMCAPFFVYGAEGRKEASPPFESVMTTDGRVVFLTFNVCTWERERAELRLVCLFL